MIKKFFNKVINFILPPRCINCGKVLFEEDGICIDCFQQINFISRPYCKKCGTPFHENVKTNSLCANCVKEKKPVFRLFRSVFVYDDFSKKMILSLKFLDKTENAKILGKLMFFSAKDIIEKDFDIIIPIPLHYRRILRRKYNQAGLLAKVLSKYCNKEISFTAVKRKKNNRPQVEFSGKSRIRNVKGVFEVKKKEEIKGKRILLVDDVYTTGSTMKECAKTLLKAGAKSVDFISVARTIHNH